MSHESKSVKRYALDARLSSFMTGPYGDGEWVKFSDIAHLLNPAPKPDVAGEVKSVKDVEAAEKYAPNRGERPNCSGHARDGFLAGISHARAQMEGSKSELDERDEDAVDRTDFPRAKMEGSSVIKKLKAERDALKEQLAKAEKDRDEWKRQAATINYDRDRLRLALERVEKLARIRGYPTPSEWAQLLDTIREALAQSKTEPGE